MEILSLIGLFVFFFFFFYLFHFNDQIIMLKYHIRRIKLKKEKQETENNFIMKLKP